ncbi:hypothetical protein A9F13_18g00187 [Clavispora lusitaniae]|uniref:Uncharacterized protein n=1 Tax=Clavispora lusitaniae TaxID=36911 RepID=A0AA91PW20_CLALS|nr:hypothetical protein A9F13_18g00187 [Clavispora lusitaniae]
MVSPTYFSKGKEYPDSDGFITVARRRRMNSLKKEIQTSAERPSFSNKSFARIAASTNVFSAIGFGDDEPTSEEKTVSVEAGKLGESKEIPTKKVTALICWKPLYSSNSDQVISPQTSEKACFTDSEGIIEWNENEKVEEEKVEEKEPIQAKPIGNTIMDKKMEKMDYQSKKMVLEMKKMDIKMKKMDLKMKKMDFKMKKMEYNMKKMDFKLKKRALKEKKSHFSSALPSRPSSRDPNMSESLKRSEYKRDILVHRTIIAL